MFGTVGFYSKLLAEDIEEIDRAQMEAIRATGADGFQVMVYGVLPQILPRIVGLTIYRWDINIRVSTIVGIVGTGGIGAELMVQLDTFNWRAVATILLAILAIVLFSEGVSAFARKKTS
ncbi:ABC transporter permease subunit [Natrialba swarupiae]|uniref:ABC transporter permease subunit n=1 Tax=Natrialba swarupiae TaxID=2448032 RepID=UPI001EE4D220|nr:ABC transporter permease subunit [Natrialba swarupiae]